MATIITLDGRPSIGKTTTISLLYDLMQGSGYSIIQDKKRRRSHDFFVIVEKKGKKIGVTTYGDSIAILSKYYDYFVRNGCTIIVSACREVGPIKLFVAHYPGFIKQSISKTQATGATARQNANTADALTLLKMVDVLL